MLESPSMLRYSSYDEICVGYEANINESWGSENSSAADNQQERLVKIGWITGFDQNPQRLHARHRIQSGEDIVRSAWRHAGRVKIALISREEKTLTKSITWPSEIPCRVSNIAQGSGDTIPMTGSNRWNPNDACTGALKGNTEGKIRDSSFPRNDLRDEILRWSRQLVHNTPALTQKSDETTSIIVVR